MKTADQSQDPLFIEENPLLSYLYLTYAVYPHLTKTEGMIFGGIWSRTNRFGVNGSTELTYQHLVNQTMRSRYRGHSTDLFQRDNQMPPCPELSEIHFKRSRKKLLDMGIIQRDGHVSFYRISCYPSDFLDPEKRLTEALKAFDSGESFGILKGISDGVSHLRRFRTL